ncbi:membrane-bound lytic murein transglycosylase MltF [Halomonas sp. hl-4]|uniref:membrane-bound lytic murein transglycosylase MltF n=1 Tax=Halomonas sp. hl-4 TaxID=1761789 RepID=UPI000BB92C9A|nr:membrane-bound lytic murein transglycosylase MltF [Halomonas sp. hl-4]SNY98721.1 membrane-bound lytic murein transglycosylase F [Halomonas sp. hl-4]
MLTLICRHFIACSSHYFALTAIALLVMMPTFSFVPEGEHLEQVRQRDFITLHTRNTPFTYYEGRNGPTGFEYELMRRFADSLGVSLNIEAQHHPESILSTVRERGDLGAAALPLLPDTPGIHYTRPIINMQPLVVYRRGINGINAPSDLVELSLGTLSGAGTGKALRELQRDYPELSWRESQELEVAELLAQVENGSLDAAVTFDHQFRINRLFFPNVEHGFALGEPVSMAWAVPSGRGLGLLEAANRFIEDLQQTGMLDQLMERYFGHDDYLEYVGTRTFLAHLDARLPRYTDDFKQAAQTTGFDWKLLAALGYQESHWDPDAVSPTGVRGLMMLTHPTAEEMDIDDRRDPAQSIDGGSRYLRSLKDRLPDDITGDDRLYMALAAYNVGLGHLYDARDIAEMRDGNPNRWADVREALPLLQQREWHSKTRFGYARGGEPVIYVRNIRRYYEMIEYVERSRQQFFQLGQTPVNADPLVMFESIPSLD